MSDVELGPRAGRMPLIGGALALDFCNTTSGVGTPGCLEHLNEFEHLVLWSAHAGVLSTPEAATVQALAAAAPAAADAAFARALHLRRTLQDLFWALARGQAAPTTALATLNDVLAEGDRNRILTPTVGGFTWRYPEVDVALDGMLGPIARSAAGILLTEPPERLKECHGPECGWLFIDRSKNNIRVWCEMEVCGSRAKARARAGRRRNA